MNDEVIFEYKLTRSGIAEFLKSRGIKSTEENVNKVVEALKSEDMGFDATDVVGVSFKTNEYELLKEIVNDNF